MEDHLAIATDDEVLAEHQQPEDDVGNLAVKMFRDKMRHRDFDV